jgi:hypothetical protein
MAVVAVTLGLARLRRAPPVVRARFHVHARLHRNARLHEDALAALDPLHGSSHLQIHAEWREICRGVRHGVRGQTVTATSRLVAGTATTTTTTTTATTGRAAITDVAASCRRGGLCGVTSENRLVVILFGREKIRGVRGELGALALGLVEHARCGLLALLHHLGDARAADVLGLCLARVTRMLRREALERGCPILQALFDRRGIPLAKRKNARLDPNQRIVLFPLLHQSSETCAHRHLGTLPDMAEQVPLDGYVRDLFIV